MTQPEHILLVQFEGGPVFFAFDEAGAREFLADVIEDGAESYTVWKVFNDTSVSQEITVEFAMAWSELFEFGSGDDWTEILRHFPDFIRAHAAEHLLEEYRGVLEQRDSDAFERAKIRSL